MSVFFSPVRAFGLTMAFAAVAGAQGAQKACEVNESRPTQVGKATLAVQVASGAQPDVAARQLTSAVKMLTDNGERMENQPGRNFVLGKALVLWTMQPNVELVTKRGPLGFSTDPQGIIDLAAAIDSAFKVVETSNPECISETSRWRGQKGWINLVNKAIEKLNSDEADLADSAARRAILLNPYAPYGYVVLANVMQKRNRSTEAFNLYKQAIDMASRDTSYDDIRRQSLLYLGNLATDSAELAPDAATKRPYVETARAAFDQIMKDKGATDFGGNARAGLCRLSIATGDTASLRTAYKQPLAAPSTFSYGELMNAGVCMARAEMIPEATMLFQAAYEKNPYHRDALSNLSIMLLRMDQHEKSLPLAERLVSVEPNNPENIQLLVLSYAGIAKRARDVRLAASRATATKTGTKAAPAKATPAKATTPAAPKLSAAANDSIFKIEKAFTDSAVSTNAQKDSLAYKVQLTDFSTSAEKATVSGTLFNLRAPARADSLTIHVDFLDKDGKVVIARETKVGPVATSATAHFTVTTAPGTGISAFRYTFIK